ncbi:hypothetical protein LQ938_06095 [Microbacterium sp. cx-55]|uniref:hypothetical protein n=1 Tax=Microbacterium sp. cx-55 TaxID=2875948 RepID=UPI001CBAC912|nr:hypothetical protein [Microbacterium sp. cx-55]MBZ4486686.1 hypothetical protein [Microbacterium sp. cx-55]UGB36354.1 hypothetical protein LQ938_06095 [Microbacterium sp. cx-55]
MTVQTHPLTDRIDRRRLRDYRRSLPTAVRPPWAGILGRALLLIGFPTALLVTWLTVLGDTVSDDGEWDWALTLILVPYAIPPVIGIVMFVRAVRRRSGVRQFRLHDFAEANRFTYQPYAPAPALPGMVFTRPAQSSSFVTDVLRRRSGHALEIGNHTCTTGSGKNTATHRWGYAAIRLPVALPHIVLDARGNNSIGRPALPIAFARDQRLSLEGDFDRHFTLYCPEGYETDALYLFSPDTMAIFVDDAARLDVELVDDYLFLYFPGQLSTLDPELWQRLLATTETLSQRVLRWERWRDDRIRTDAQPFVDSSIAGPGAGRGVAQQGRRLSVRQDWWWVLGAAFAVFGLVNLVIDTVSGWLS